MPLFTPATPATPAAPAGKPHTTTGTVALPDGYATALRKADASWQPVLRAGLAAVAKADPAYLPVLESSAYLPTENRLFAAFTLPLDDVRYVLVGEGPYPRAHSATGVCFMDGAVDGLWAAGGLSKAVNRATSLRNFMKMLLVADGQLDAKHTSGDALAHIAARARTKNSGIIATLPQLQAGLHRHGFLLLNASLVFRTDVAPKKDAQAWRPFLQTVLDALRQHAIEQHRPAPILVLWGKIAEQLQALPGVAEFPQRVSEHPYNLSFIDNASMQQLFGPLKLLQST